MFQSFMLWTYCQGIFFCCELVLMFRERVPSLGYDFRIERRHIHRGETLYCHITDGVCELNVGLLYLKTFIFPIIFIAFLFYVKQYFRYWRWKENKIKSLSSWILQTLGKELSVSNLIEISTDIPGKTWDAPIVTFFWAQQTPDVWKKDSTWPPKFSPLQIWNPIFRVQQVDNIGNWQWQSKPLAHFLDQGECSMAAHCVYEKSLSVGVRQTWVWRLF